MKSIELEEWRGTIIREPGSKVIDVRTEVECEATGHVSGAEVVNFFGGAFLVRLQSLNASDTYFLCCRDGRRSKQAANLMKTKGYKSVFHLKGGLNSFDGEIADILPQKKKSTATTGLSDDKDIVGITIKENGPLLVKGPVRIQLGDQSVVNEKPFVAICRCGASSKNPYCDGSHSKIGKLEKLVLEQ